MAIFYTKCSLDSRVIRKYEGAPDPRPGGSGRRDGDGVVHRARDPPAPGRGEEPRRIVCRPPGSERDAGDGAGRPVEPRGDPRRRVGDAAVDGALRRRERGHLAPVPAEDDRSVRGLAGHPGERGGRGERQPLHRQHGCDERHGVHLSRFGPGTRWARAIRPPRRGPPRTPPPFHRGSCGR